MNNRIKKFLSYYKPYLRLFYTVMACALVGSGIALLYPLLTRYITKDILENDLSSALSQIYIVCGIMLVLVVIQNLCQFVVDYHGHKMGAMMESDMRRELFEHYQKLSFNFYDTQKTGQLMSRVTNDLLLLSELYHHGPEDYIKYFIKFVGAFIILFFINAKLTLAIFCFLPLMAVFALYFNKKVNIALRRNKDRIADINAQVEDNLSGIRVVQSFGNEDYEANKFHYENNRFLESRKNGYKSEAYFSTGMDIFVQLITITVIVFGGINIVHASLDLADLITFLLYIAYLIEPIQKLTHVTMQFQDGITGFDRFMEMLEIEPSIKDSSNAMELKNVQGDVQFQNVSFNYNGNNRSVLNNISLEINSGDYIALVGPSGIGKTTLCSLIPRFYDVNAGEVLIDGINVKDISLHSLRRNVGIVQQDVYLFAGTVLENIRYGKPDATKEEIIAAAKNANAHDFIIALPNGYETDIGQRGVKLSGGQKQRLSIARVFLKNPPILIFDEATSALDNESEKIVKESLEALAKNRTTIVIAHRLSTIRNAKRIIVLTDDGITEEGTHEELLALDRTYAHLYNMQFVI
ncbi:ABC transporter ATP-binding protein [Lederbergia wuyishanensis]|uniref:ATP-binding cassette subfamily B protein n=1 Tax=Lederbergia wuyishanensis TaxID=1347903 RepID=A0ABU0D0I5_9BACI|nr:ABC transporter ATP-binding protein [Lederbergia wuyishanensis]MCJ8006518.1 ABC transporter ATP-binding protein/permease [Lederbergia wuyishanensis]MDQ0341895.1 ATP-binding cassette subfamily B protein [Lederbergia wuyishanensis]